MGGGGGGGGGGVWGESLSNLPNVPSDDVVNKNLYTIPTEYCISHCYFTIQNLILLLPGFQITQDSKS